MVDVILAGVVGLILGSFTSVVVERLGVKGGIIAGRSECPSCMHTLAWYDLIPLLSYLMLRGRCRYCSVGIPARYPLVELVMAMALATFVWLNGWHGWLAVLEAAVVVLLVILLFFDARHQLLPDELVVPLGAMAVVRIAVFGIPEPTSAAAGALFLLVLFAALHTFSSGRWMGFGDVGLGMVLGLLFGGFGSLVLLILGTWAGALVGILLMVRGRASMKSALPFGSFLAGTGVILLIWQALIPRILLILTLQ